MHISLSQMFVFVHGTLATPSLWLPQIRAILSLGREYSDQQLINLFTLQLPGHPNNDASFAFKDFKQQLEQFQLNTYSKQQELAQKLLLNGDRQVVNYLQDKKLVIVGHSVGGALSIEYTLKNPTNVKKLIIVSTPVRFNTAYIRSLYTGLSFFKGNRSKVLAKFGKLLPFPRWRVAADLLRRNPKQLGLGSCIDYIKDYNFQELYEVSSLNQHLALNKIPILMIGGSYDVVASVRSIKKLHNVLITDNEIMNTKKTVIKGQRNAPDPVTSIIYPSGHNPMDTKLVEFCSDVRNFLFD